MLINASSGERCSSFIFALLVYVFVSAYILREPNEIGYGKKKVETFTDSASQQRSKYRQVNMTKHAGTGTNYPVLANRIQLKHEKKPVSNLKRISTECNFPGNIYQIY